MFSTSSIRGGRKEKAPAVTDAQHIAKNAREKYDRNE